MLTLLPCTCGNDDIFIHEYVYYSDGSTEGQVTCKKCHRTVYGETLFDAIRIWNLGHDTPNVTFGVDDDGKLVELRRVERGE